jgi:hypothetical protein
MSELRRHIMMQTGGGIVPFVNADSFWASTLSYNGNTASYGYLQRIEFNNLMPQDEDVCLWCSVERTSYLGVRIYLTQEGYIKITSSNPNNDTRVIITDPDIQTFVMYGDIPSSHYDVSSTYHYSNNLGGISTINVRIPVGFAYKGFGAYFKKWNGTPYSRPSDLKEFSVFESAKITIWSGYSWFHLARQAKCAEYVLNKDEQTFTRFDGNDNIVDVENLTLFQRI